jgi:uncharacterized protein YjdB
MNLSLSKVFRNKYIMSGMIISIILLCIVLTMAISNADGTAGITYRAHVAYNGWMDWASDGATAGTTGESRRMEAIKIKLTGDMAGDVIYQTFVRDMGWQAEVKNSETSGVEGQSKQIEAIKIRLDGEVKSKYNILYRVHVKNKGWLEWVSNGAMAGSDTEALRIEAIEIKLEEIPQTEAPEQTQYENNRGQITNLTDDEMAMFVAIIYCESGGESYEGKLGVANVILNRLYGGKYGSTLKDVIYANSQFTPASNGTLDKRINQYKNGQFTEKAHKECIEAAKEACGGHNNIGSRTNFMTKAAYASSVGSRPDKLVIGNHVFFTW